MLFAREGRRVLNEQEFAMTDGSLTRMDRVIIDPGVVTVLDYKTGDEKPGHTEQVTNTSIFSGFSTRPALSKAILSISIETRFGLCYEPTHHQGGI